MLIAGFGCDESSTAFARGCVVSWGVEFVLFEGLGVGYALAAVTQDGVHDAGWCVAEDSLSQYFIQEEGRSEDGRIPEKRSVVT